jgi:hypothetical protein
MQHERKLERDERKAEAGLVSERYPRVERIVLNMTYYQGVHIPVLMERTVNFFPTSFAYFRMQCFNNGCESGVFDLEPVIAKLVRKGEKGNRGTMQCSECTHLPKGERGSISYSITVLYKS